MYIPYFFKNYREYSLTFINLIFIIVFGLGQELPTPGA